MGEFAAEASMRASRTPVAQEGRHILANRILPINVWSSPGHHHFGSPEDCPAFRPRPFQAMANLGKPRPEVFRLNAHEAV
jgi:hypothetical protein